MKEVVQQVCFVAVLAAVALCFPQQADSAILSWGDVQPPDPASWGPDASVYVGYSEPGEVSVSDGDTVVSKSAMLAYMPGSSGSVNVEGAGSAWTSYGGFTIGFGGPGILSIKNGGRVISAGGEVGVDDPSAVTVDGAGSTWLCRGNLILDNATLNVTNGGTVANRNCELAILEISTTTVTVDGAGSTWTCDGYLCISVLGRAMLNITNGAAVNVSGDTWVAKYDWSIGELHLSGGTLTTGGLLASPADLTGTGTIDTHGLVSDLNLVFDSAHGVNQTFVLNSEPGQNITINLTQDGTGSLGAGYAGEGTLTIRDGVSVESHGGYIGWKSGSRGTAAIEGPGSSWVCDGDLYVGAEGYGILSITVGASVSNSGSAYVGYGHFDLGNATGTVTIDGPGSTWTCGGVLYIGRRAYLHITNGGLMKALGVRIYSGDSSIKLSSGGMLALYGEADDSIADFLDLVSGTDAILYWNGTEWDSITNATYGVDYRLIYYDSGSLAGYTVLIVPEPATLLLLGIGGGLVLLRYRRSAVSLA